MATEPAALTLAPAPESTLQPLEFSAEQRKLIRDSFAGGASDSEFAVLMEVARLRRLNPILRQIHFVKRNAYDEATKSYKQVWAHQVSIDGFRAIADRTGRYDGQDEPEFEYQQDGKTLKLARVRVYKKGVPRPFVGVCHFREYAQAKRDGGLTKMWDEKPHVMLAKCAEAQGIRKGFPEETSGVYIEEEMEPAPERDVSPLGPQHSAPPPAPELGARKPDEVIPPPPAAPAARRGPGRPRKADTAPPPAAAPATAPAPEQPADDFAEPAAASPETPHPGDALNEIANAIDASKSLTELDGHVKALDSLPVNNSESPIMVQLRNEVIPLVRLKLLETAMANAASADALKTLVPVISSLARPEPFGRLRELYNIRKAELEKKP